MSEQKKSLKSKIAVFFTSLIILGLGGLSIYLFADGNSAKDEKEKYEKKYDELLEKNKESEKDAETDLDDKDEEISNLKKEVKDLEKELADLKKENETCGVESDEETVLPVVVLEAEGSFSASDKTRIKSRYVEPYSDYQAETQTDNKVVSIVIGKNLLESGSDYPFTFMSIFENGGYESFLIEDSKPADQDWWVPGCMNGCTFSDEFETKYPEIVELTG